MADDRDLTEQRAAALVRAGVTIRRWRDYAKPLFHNLYNYTLLTGAAVASSLTHNWTLLAVAIGCEAVWMINAPDNKWLRRKLDAKFDAAALAERVEAREAMILTMPKKIGARCRALIGKHREIVRLAGENTQLEGALLAPELAKLDELVDAFLELCLSCVRQDAYLEKENVADIERQRRVYEQATKGTGGPADDLNRQNLAVVLRRLAVLQELRDFLLRSQHQIALIENHFALIADQIITMRTPQELSQELDALADGVQAIRDTERLVGRTMASVEHQPVG